jgi:Domain of unknown function (DUF222)
MTSQLADRSHPVVEFAHQLTDRLDQLATRPVWSMSPAEQRDALRELARAEAQLSALNLRVLAEAERSGAGEERAAASAADWVAVETRQTRISARSDLKLATALEHHPLVSSAMDSGAVNVAQARAIVTAVDRLPTSGEFAVSAEQREQAEAHLVKLAADYDAKALAVLGRRLFEVIAPDLADAYEGKVLADQEAAAARRVRFSMREDDAGTCHGRFRIPTLHGQWLRKMILALCSPVRSTASDIDVELPTEVRHGIAFTQLIEAIPAKSLPKTGGCGATIVVTMRLDQLLADLHAAGVCTLDTGGQITAAQARRLACQVGIIPAVLGSKSQVLDLGRKSRGYTEHQRIALALTQGGCTAVDCDRPPAMCDAHHDLPWSHGGRTDLATGRLLCGHHHRRIHDPAYASHHLPNGKIAFHRRT